MEKTVKNKWLILAAVLFIIVFSGHTVQTIYPLFQTLCTAVALVLVAVSILMMKKWVPSVAQFALGVIAFTVTLTMLIYLKDGSVLYYLSIIVCAAAAFCISGIFDFKQLARTYVFVMTVITVISVVCYFSISSSEYLRELPTVTNFNDFEYKISPFFNYMKNYPERNCAVFWEPGIFATHLTVSMILEAVCLKKTSIIRMVIFTVGIFTANSSAGFVLWFLCMLILVVSKVDKKHLAITATVGVAALAVAVLFITNLDTIIMRYGLDQNPYFSKLLSDQLAESTRWNAISHNLEIFIRSPLWGVGIQSAIENIKFVGDTSTTTYMMSVFGILGLSYTVFLGYGILKNINKNVFVRILILVAAMFIINKEPHQTILLTWCLMFYLLRGNLGGGEEAKAKPSEEVMAD